ncbi:dTMP kinase [Clostridium sp. C1]|uniref:dTMP kinase n=1 Tax=Clostridium sp. C1 TaxID=1155388 RepID=UPI0024B0F437|nr:dTMP kinase [Clostridium sp. C1]
MMAGVFITFEGGEGSGKTTIANMIQKTLAQEGYHVVLTREPGGVEIAEKIRDIIHDVKYINMDRKTEALLYAASRRQHLVEKVIPALENDAIVICDRFVDSSMVYQGIARGIGIDEVYQMNLFATENILPKRTIFFDIQPEDGLKRVYANKDREVNRLDLENIDFHRKVYQGYLSLCDKFPNRIVKIDASLDIDHVYQQVLKKIREIL